MVKLLVIIALLAATGCAPTYGGGMVCTTR